MTALGTQATVSEALGSVRHKTEKGVAPVTLMVHGSGGESQGPAVHMAQNLERLADPGGAVKFGSELC